jgi:hypothetical protein
MANALALLKISDETADPSILWRPIFWSVAQKSALADHWPL